MLPLQAFRLFSLRSLVLISFIFLVSIPSLANVYSVTVTSDGHATNQLRGAIEAADALGGTHTINIAAGTYTLTLGQIAFGTTAQNITITGAGPSSTIISMTTGAGRDRIFTINYNGLTSNVITTISGVKFQNGYLTSDTFGGAAIYAGPVSPAVETLNISNTAFENNICPGAAGSGGTGGAINMFQGTINIDNSTFTNNQSVDGDGGAIIYLLYNQGGSGVLSITNSTFTGNTAKGNGGAVSFLAQGGALPGQNFTVNITKNNFVSNSATGFGGAIVANNSMAVSTPSVNYNRFVGNASTASAASGAFHFAESAGSVNAENNWWGCNTGPSAAPCDRAGGDVAGGGSLVLSKWLQLKTTAAPSPICNTSAGLGNTTTVTTGFLSNSASETITAANLAALAGRTVNWGPTVLGTLSGLQTSIQSSGTATATFTSNGSGGTATVNAQVDNVPTSETSPARASLTVNTLPAITSLNAATFTTGVSGTFNMSATGSPAPTFAKTGTLPSNVTLSSAGVLSGTPAAGTGGTYPIVVSATNVCGAPTQNFTLTVNQAPAISSQNSTTFTVGANGSFQLTASGFPSSFTFTNTGSALPGGVTLSPSGLLGGTPNPGTGGIYNLAFQVSNGVSPAGTQNFTLTVNQAPAFTNPNRTNFTVGTNGSFQLAATGFPSSFTFTNTGNALPSGVTLSPSGLLSGTPNPGTGGDRVLTFQVSNGVSPAATQNFVLRVIDPAIKSISDFDGDGRSDVSVYRPSDGFWYTNRSSTGYSAIQWGGLPGDTVIPGDYDGDGKADFAIWRPSDANGVADFYVLNSNGFTVSGYSHGSIGDIPVTGDFDGDGKSDIVVFRPSTGTWYLWESSTQTTRSALFGQSGDVPMGIDNDGDGKANLAVYRPGDGYWYIARATGVPAQNFVAVPFGLSTDILVPGDYDGDGKADIAVFRPSNGTWYIIRSSDGGVVYTPFGANGDVPVPGDYDGDGRTDVAVYRGGVWYVNGSTSGFATQAFGLPTDKPIPAAYHP